MPDNKENTNDCNFPKFEKNKYFYGKLMTVRDFEAEQDYFDGKRCLINRLLHGMGIVCGFKDVKIDNNNDETFTINFNDGGIALTYYGNEIVVPPSTKKQINDEYCKPIKNLISKPHLYLKYQSHDEGYVSVASSSSSCKEKCCPGRAVDDFEVVALGKSPDSEKSPNSIGCRYKSKTGSNEIIDVNLWLDALEKEHISCPLCRENQGDIVFLGKVGTDDGSFIVNREDSEKHRIFFTQKELYQILKCHIQDSENPHKVDATQTKALVSINEVCHPGGNIDLCKDNSIENSIVITTDEKKKSITIGEDHSTKMDNPHKVDATQIGALVSINNVNPGNKPGNNINLVRGTNITITPDINSIKIDCDIKPAETVIKSIGTKNSVGESPRYAREDHVHKLEGTIDSNINLLRLLAILLAILIILVLILILQ